MTIFEEIPVGEVAEHKGKFFICVERDNSDDFCCKLCETKRLGIWQCHKILCDPFERKDKKSVYLKEFQKPMPYFDLTEALNDKPICTKNGIPAKVVRYNGEDEDDNYDYPLEVERIQDGKSAIFYYTDEGKIMKGQNSEEDLIMKV